MLNPCIICYRKSDGEVDWDVRETLKMFFPLLESYLKVDTADEKQLPEPLFQKLINAGMVSCAECLKVVKSFCELYDQMKSIEIELNSGLMTLQGRISRAEKDFVRKKEFGNCAKELVDIGDGADAEESIECIFQFKRDLILKCGRKLKTMLDDVCQPRGNKDPLDLNYSIPVIKIQDDTNVGLPRSKIFKLESLGIDQVEDVLYTSISDTGPSSSRNKQFYSEHPQMTHDTEDLEEKGEDEDGNEDNDSSGSEYEMSSGTNSECDDRDSPRENNFDEDFEPQIPIMAVNLNIPPPTVCSFAGEPMEEEGVPSSIMDPETGKYKCRICAKEFNTITNIARHSKSLHSNIRYKCTLCNKHFKRQDLYKHHYQKVHVGMKPKPKTGKHKCPVCKKTFSSRGGLDRHHQSIHLGIKFQCPRCDKQFAQKGGMVRHQRNSCGQPVTKPNSQINHCDQSKEASKLKEEDPQKTHGHASADDLECTVCGKKFDLGCDLKAHRGNMHAEYPDPEVN